MLKILVVDDDALFRRLILRMLRGVSNVECIEASGVLEASALLKQHRPTILLTDLQMADGGGVDLLETLPGLSANTLPILMSGVASLRDYQSALRLGAVDVLTKPFTKDELFAVLQRALDSGTGFRGMVHGLLLTDLLQMLHLASRSLVLEVRSPLALGEVVFEKGQLIHAQVGSRQGLEALQELVSLRAGTIHTHPFRETQQTITGSFQEVLMDAFREVDESQRDVPTKLSTLPPWSGETLSVSSNPFEGLCTFLRELDPEMGLALLDQGVPQVLEQGSLPPELWERLGQTAATALARSQISWTQIQWFVGSFGTALLHSASRPEVLLIAQKFGGRLDDRRFRWNISRIERFLREEQAASKG